MQVRSKDLVIDSNFVSSNLFTLDKQNVENQIYAYIYRSVILHIQVLSIYRMYKFTQVQGTTTPFFLSLTKL